MQKKCPYLSTQLECYAGGSGHANCMNDAFHKTCDHKRVADRRVKKEQSTAVSMNN